MTAIIPADDFALAIARSAFIDAHNNVDASVRRQLAALNCTPAPLLGQNIDTLTKVAANPLYSKQRKTRVDVALGELKQLQSIRCDLVHSQMQRLVIDQIVYGFFPNVQKQPRLGRVGLLVTHAELEEYTLHLIRLAKDLNA